MIPWILLDKAQTPEGGKELTLYQHDKDFAIRVGNLELMSSRMHGSEDALAELAIKELKKMIKPRLLIGGLGMGFTLRAALDLLPPDAHVAVAELVPGVVDWNRRILGHLAGNPLRDKRVRVHEVNVAEMIRKGRSEYDAILLDVDNGPEAFSHPSNAWLYDFKGLDAAHIALQKKGVLALWSVAPDRGFTRRLNKARFNVNELQVRKRAGGKGAGHHHMWIATRY